jgi:hypothetical protein
MVYSLNNKTVSKRGHIYFGKNVLEVYSFDELKTKINSLNYKLDILID